MSRDSILSSIASAPLSYFVYSALSFYASRRGGEIPGTWFVRALEPLGRDEASVRQTLYRMEREQEIHARKDGRVKWYRATPFATAEVDAGTSKIFDDPDDAWDGAWTIVHLQFDGGERVERDRMRSILQVEGFAPLGPGVFVHPRDRSARVCRAVEELGLAEHLAAFRGTPVGGRNLEALGRRLWDLRALGRAYERFLRIYQPLLASGPSRGKAEAEQFALRFAVVFAFLTVAWRDPDLPNAMLPSPWPGVEARRVARELYEELQPGALAHGDTLLAQATGSSHTLTRILDAYAKSSRGTGDTGGERRRRRPRTHGAEPRVP